MGPPGIGISLVVVNLQGGAVGVGQGLQSGKHDPYICPHALMPSQQTVKPLPSHVGEGLVVGTEVVKGLEVFVTGLLVDVEVTFLVVVLAFLVDVGVARLVDVVRERLVVDEAFFVELGTGVRVGNCVILVEILVAVAGQGGATGLAETLQVS